MSFLLELNTLINGKFHFPALTKVSQLLAKKPAEIKTGFTDTLSSHIDKKNVPCLHVQTIQTYNILFQWPAK